MNNATAHPRHSTSLPPLSAREWSDTATNYRDAAALAWDVLNVRAGTRLDAYAARYSARALAAWHASRALPLAA